MVQNMNLIWDHHTRGFQSGHRGRDACVDQIVARIIVEPNDKNPGMASPDSENEVVEIGEVFVISRENQATCGHGPGQEPGIGHRS